MMRRMGGIVIADCARSIVKGYEVAGEQRVWPHIVGIMAYDTPYLGVHPGTFKNTATEAWSYLQQAQAVASSVGAGWAFLNKGKEEASSLPNTSPKSAGKEKTPSRKSSSASLKSAASSKGKQKAENQDESTALTQKLSNAGKAAQTSAASTGSGSWLKYGYAAAGAGA